MNIYRGHPFLVIVVVLLLAGCAREPQPAARDIEDAFAQKLPAFARLDHFEVEAMQNLGTKVEPDWQARFSTGVKIPVDTFIADGAESGAKFVRPLHHVGDVIPIFGKSDSHLFAGKWISEFHLDGDPLAGLGLPLASLTGQRVIVRGSKDEADFHAELAEQEKQRQLKRQHDDEDHRRAVVEAEQERQKDQRDEEERRRVADQAEQRRLSEEFAEDEKRNASAKAPATQAVSSPSQPTRFVVPSDAVQPNAVWMADGGATFTVLQRIGEWFQGRYQRDSGNVVQEVTGTVKGNQIFWTSNHIYVIRGSGNGDVYGTFDGDKIYFNIYNDDATWHATFYRLRSAGVSRANVVASTAAPTAPNAPAVPATPAPEPFPSARLRDFVSTYEDRVLAPLGAAGLDHSNVIAEFADSLADDATKAPPGRRLAYQACVLVCNTLTNANEQRLAAIANLQGIASSKNSGSLGVVSSPRRLTWKQLHSEARAREQVTQGEDSFANSQSTAWLQRTAQLRQNVQALMQREKELERQIAAAEQLSQVESSRAEAIRQYPGIAVNGSALNRAFVARYGYYQKQQPAYFQDTAWPLRLAEEVAQAAPPK